METNCNQMSAMQRNGRNMRNGNCNYGRNGMPGNGMSGNGMPGNRGNMGGNSRMMRDGVGRTMEVECVCKTNSSCYREDAMAGLGSQFPVGMAYVPWQQWGELYDAECGLMQGTIFKDLNLIFCGVRC